MDHYGKISLTVGLALALGAGAMAAQAADDAAASSLARSMAACGRIAKAPQRVACYDALNQSANPSTTAERLESRRRNFGIAAPRIAKPFAAPAAVRQARAAPPSDEGVDHIQARLDHLSRTPTGQLILTTTEGAVWELDDSSASVQPAQGAQILIRRGALGGLFCDLDRWRAIRCKRLE